MLQAWLPPRWALVGVLLMTVRLLAAYGSQQWAYGYWGGSVAALGGALLFGAGRRLWERPTWTHASVLGAGLAILANSRPLEGLVVSVLMTGALAWRHVVARPFAIPASLLKLSGGATIMLIPTMLWMGFYNQQVTGNWRKLPYRVHLEQYTQVPIFLWQGSITAEQTYASELQRDFHSTYEKTDWNRIRTTDGMVGLVTERLAGPIRYYLGWILLVPFLMGIRSRRPWSLFATLTIGALWLIGLQTSWFHPHYLAPITCLFAYQVTFGLRRIAHWRFGHRYFGHTMVQLISLAYLVLAIAALVPLGTKPSAWQYDRVQLQQQLIQAGGRHLVIVHYEPTHVIHHEWVYNAAEIDGASVVWARENALDKSLQSYFQDRTIWRLYADETPPRLEQLRGPIEAAARGA
jgi:hypothetical protein